ncbi:uncharacterized protein LOC114762242 [Neltuma alba]|uniref:uncharacterized protein LOC114762242 n=1 Tax=Neltuma alba TaxID=207710 RepID=UPI0010A47E46|nr:uncharacterized protein LOC114762242 [Prosopis alba]
MYGYFLTRGELQCLQCRRWIDDRFMTIVTKTFIGDQKEKDGRVNHHIFSADFMQKMVANPLSITFMRLQAEEEETKKKGGEQQHDVKKKKKRTNKGQFDPKQFMATQTMNCFHSMLRAVKPKLFVNEDKIDNEVKWAKVYVQNDT